MKKIILSVVVAASIVIAAEPNVKTESPFVTHTELGYIETQGNTKTQIFSLDAKAKKNWNKHAFSLLFDGQYASDHDVETKNKFLIELNYDYAFTDVFAFNYLVGYKDDKFSGYAYQFYTGPGAKYTAIKAQKHNLILDANILYSQDYIEDAFYIGDDLIAYPNPHDGFTKKVPGGKVDYAGYRAKAVYNWQILENLKFDQELSYRSDFGDADNYFAFSKTGFTSKLSDIFSAGINYKVDYINKAADGKEYSDRTFTANIIVDY